MLAAVAAVPVRLGQTQHLVLAETVAQVLGLQLLQAELLQLLLLQAVAVHQSPQAAQVAHRLVVTVAPSQLLA
jgi:hypothetical protein